VSAASRAGPPTAGPLGDGVGGADGPLQADTSSPPATASAAAAGILVRAWWALTPDRAGSAVAWRLGLKLALDLTIGSSLLLSVG
jgi:hypothetical protein